MVERAESFTVSRTDLRKILVNLGLDEKNIITLFGILNRAHKHVNAISLVSTIERMGFDREKSARVLRRMGMDDVTIANVFRMVDESKIDSEIGRVYNATIEFS